MKKTFLIFLLCCLLLAGCGEKKPALTGTWVNEGQYTEGRDFVETMTLKEDGTALVHLDFQGKPYADLEGTYVLAEADEMLIVTLSDGTVRAYRFTLTDTTLSLVGNGKSVEYRRSE